MLLQARHVVVRFPHQQHMFLLSRRGGLAIQKEQIKVNSGSKWMSSSTNIATTVNAIAQVDGKAPESPSLSGMDQLSTTSDIATGSTLEQAVALVDPTISSLGFGPTDTIIRILQQVHESAGLPWWASILAMTVFVRTSILPLVIMSQKNTSNLIKATPEMELFKAEVKANPPQTEQDRIRQGQRLRDIYKKYDISMLKTIAPIVVQMPLFITFFLGLRRLSTTYPTMKEGGMLWFADLSVPDPTYALPIIAAASFLVTIEMGGEVQNPNMDSKTMKNMLRGLGVAMIPMTMSFESGVFVYWVTTNVFSVVQIATLKQPAVRNWLGLPDMNALKPPKTDSTVSLLKRVDQMIGKSKPTLESITTTPATGTKPQSEVQQQFLSEMKEARARRSKRRV